MRDCGRILSVAGRRWWIGWCRDLSWKRGNYENVPGRLFLSRLRRSSGPAFRFGREVQFSRDAIHRPRSASVLLHAVLLTAIQAAGIAGGVDVTPSPILILEVIKAISEAVREYFRWLQTDEGKRFSAQAMADRAAWDKFWLDAGSGVKQLFSGEFLK